MCLFILEGVVGFLSVLGCTIKADKKLFYLLWIQFWRYLKRLRQSVLFTVNVSVEQVTDSGPLMKRVVGDWQSSDGELHEELSSNWSGPKVILHRAGKLSLICSSFTLQFKKVGRNLKGYFLIRIKPKKWGKLSHKDSHLFSTLISHYFTFVNYLVFRMKKYPSGQQFITYETESFHENHDLTWGTLTALYW